MKKFHQMVKSSSKAKSDRVAFKYKMPPVQSLTKRKRNEKVRKQDTEDLLLIQKQHEEEEKKLTEEEAAFITGLKKKRVTSEEVKMLRKAKIRSFDTLMNYANENPKVQGITELRFHEITKAALEARKVSGIKTLLKQTAYGKKRKFVIVRNLPPGYTHYMLLDKFKRYRPLVAEVEKSKHYGMVYFKTKDRCRMAALGMDGVDVLGNFLKVEVGSNEFAEGSSQVSGN